MKMCGRSQCQRETWGDCAGAFENDRQAKESGGKETDTRLKPLEGTLALQGP